MSEKTKNLIENRRELVFLYSVREANPNGDPDDENRPRTDDEGYALVSDVRLKRTVRDYLESNGHKILVRREYDENGGILNMDQLITNSLGENERTRPIILEKIPRLFIDARLFGFVGTVSGANCSLTGPVQFAIGKSLNQPNITTHTITSVMSGASEAGGAIGRYHILDYALFRFQGVICPKLAELSGMNESDLEILYNALWKGTQTINTRSKFNHVPQLLLAFRSKDKEFLCGELAYQLSLEKNDDFGHTLVMDGLIDRIVQFGKENLEAIEFKYNPGLKLRYDGQDYEKFEQLWKSTTLSSIKTEEMTIQ